MTNPRIGFRGVAATLAPLRVSVEELAASQLLDSPAERLRELGFTHAHVAEGNDAALTLAAESARAAMLDADVTAAEIDVIIWASALPRNHLAPPPVEPATPRKKLLGNFQYAGGALQEMLELENAQLLAVTQQGCCTMFTALRLAHALLASEPGLANILCVGADVLPPHSPREIMYNVISDAGCAVVVSHDATRDRWLGFGQISKGYYWDTIGREKEIIAAYFPTACAAIVETLASNSVAPADIGIILPTGVSRASWEILLRLAGIDPAKLYTGGLSFGHTIASDNFLFLQHLRQNKAIAPGTPMLLFTYGFGSSWCTLLLEH